MTDYNTLRYWCDSLQATVSAGIVTTSAKNYRRRGGSGRKSFTNNYFETLKQMSYVAQLAILKSVFCNGLQADQSPHWTGQL